MESFNIGRTLSRAANLARDSLVSVGVFLLVIQALGVLLQYAAMSQLRATLLSAQQPGNPAAALAIFGSGWYWGSMLISLGVASLAYAGAIAGMLKLSERGTTSVADCFTAGFAKLLPFLGLSILAGITVGLGFVLLVVPGIILVLMWSVAAPAMLGENIGIIASLGRSRALTRGSRLMIFVTLLIVGIAIYVIMFAVIGALLGLHMGSMATDMVGNPLAMAFALLYGWVGMIAGNALMVAIYLETLAIKGGGPVGHLDEVFA